jgi:hypothetical protein
MPTFRVKVFEKREYSCWYTVEARNEEEAREAAEAGDTIDEEEIDLIGVIDRQIDPSDPIWDSEDEDEEDDE